MKLKHIGLILLTLAAAGCCSDYNFRAYVVADRMSYNADLLFQEKLIENNPAISDLDKLTLKRKLEAKGQAIEAAEELLGIKK